VSSRNRERRIRNQQERAAEQEYLRQRARRMRIGIPIVLLLIALAVAGFFVARNNDDDNNVSADGANKKCVKFDDDLPEGAPKVDVKVGPAPTKLYKKDLKIGTGDEVQPGANVTAQYIGVLCTTGKIFDSSYKTGQPVPFSLTGVIPGWTQGIPGMKVGGQRLLGIPSELAYGANPPPGSGIPIDEPLWFVVDITATSPAPDASSTTTVPSANESSTTLPTTSTS
jgi:peptidylprolyl isomerase